jgi:hypothetical protein
MSNCGKQLGLHQQHQCTSPPKKSAMLSLLMEVCWRTIHSAGKAFDDLMDRLVLTLTQGSGLKSPQSSALADLPTAS